MLKIIFKQRRLELHDRTEGKKKFCSPPCSWKYFCSEGGKNPVGYMPATFFFCNIFFFFSLGTSNPTPTQLALVAAVGERGGGPGKSTHRKFDFGNFFSFGPAHHLLRWCNGVWGKGGPSSPFSFLIIPISCPPHWSPLYSCQGLFPPSWDRRVSIKRKEGQAQYFSLFPGQKNRVTPKFE